MKNKYPLVYCSAIVRSYLSKNTIYDLIGPCPKKPGWVYVKPHALSGVVVVKESNLSEVIIPEGHDFPCVYSYNKVKCNFCGLRLGFYHGEWRNLDLRISEKPCGFRMNEALS